MTQRPPYRKTGSKVKEPEGLYAAIITRIVGSDVYVKVPRLTQEFEHGPIPYVGSPGEVGDQILVGFLEGDRDAVVGIFPGSGSGSFPIENTFLVAASDSLQTVKDRADYVCDGTTDMATIRAAILALGFSGGRVMLAAGTYNTVCDYNLSAVVGNSVIVDGEGRGTVIKPTNGTVGGASNQVFTINGFGQVRNMTFDLSLINSTKFEAISVTSADAFVERCVFKGLDANGGNTENFYIRSTLSSSTGADGYAVRECEFIEFQPTTDFPADEFAAVYTRGMSVYNSTFEYSTYGFRTGITPWAICADSAWHTTIAGNTIYGSSVYLSNVWNAQVVGNQFRWDSGGAGTPPTKASVHLNQNQTTSTPYHSVQINSNQFHYNDEVASVNSAEFPHIYMESDAASTIPMSSVQISNNMFYYGGVGIGLDFATEALIVNSNYFAATNGVHRYGLFSNMNPIEVKQLEASGNMFNDAYVSTILANPEPTRADYQYGGFNFQDADFGQVNVQGNMSFIGDKTPYYYGYSFFECDPPGRTVSTHRPNWNISYNMILSPYDIQPYSAFVSSFMLPTNDPVPGSIVSTVGNFVTNTRHDEWRGIETVAYKANLFPASDPAYEYLNSRIDFGWTTASTAPLYQEIVDNMFVFQKDYQIRARTNRAGSFAGNLMGFRQSFSNSEAALLRGDGQWHIADNTVTDPPNDFWGTSYLKQSGIEVQGSTFVSTFNGTDADVVSSTVVPGNPKYLNQRQIETGIAGDATVATGAKRIPIMSKRRIVAVSVSANQAPTGSDLVVDVNLNGTSVFPTSTKPTITAGTNWSDLFVPDTQDLVSGDYLTIDVDSVGSTTPGSDLVVIIYWVPTP